MNRPYHPLPSAALLMAAFALLLSACALPGFAPQGPTMSIDPSQGPSGTEATITITGAQPNAPVTLDLDPGTTSGTTDASGAFSYTFTFFGQVGDVANVKATIGSGADEQSASATFEITGEAGMPISDDTGLAPEGEQAGLKVSVDPEKGPSGTTATITVSGGEPNQPVTLKIGEATTSGTTDADGNFTYEFTFYGQVGNKIPIEAQVGPSADSPKASATFEITAPLEGTFNATAQVAGGDKSHGPNIKMPSELQIGVRHGSLIFEGPAPWVTVSGELNRDGTFSAAGTGTVAGFPNIRVTFNGTISLQHLEGDYTMGADGGLPGGQPIIYRIEGEGAQGDEAVVEEGLSLAKGFFERFNELQAAGNAEGLYALLHPAVIDLYGEEACMGYLTGIVNPSVVITPVELVDQAAWEWQIDGRTTSIEEAYALQVQVVSDEGEALQQAHLATRPDGSLGWFTDCGDPLN